MVLMRMGQIADSARTSAGYRDYPTGAAEVVRFIKHAQQLVSLDDVDIMLKPGRWRTGRLRRRA
jgi:hypothetical protein